MTGALAAAGIGVAAGLVIVGAVVTGRMLFFGPDPIFDF